MAETSLQLLLPNFLRNRKALGRSKRTVETYNLATRELSRYLLTEYGDDSTTRVDRRVLEDFLIEYMIGRSTTTANKTFRSLRALFNWLWSEEFISNNPFAGKRKAQAPPVDSRNRFGYTLAEVKAQLALVREQQSSPKREGWLAVRDHALLLVLYDTGLRASEVCNMTIDGTNLDSGLFEVPGKGRKIYRRHLGKATITAIRRYLEQLELIAITTGPLWRNFSGYSFTRSGLYRMCVLRSQAADIKDGTVHRWRYTHAETLQDMDWPEEIIMAEMGHSVLAVSRHYRETAIRRRALKQHEEQSPADQL